MTHDNIAKGSDKNTRLPLWAAVLLPIFALAVTVGLLLVTEPMAVFRGNLPPIEDLSIQRVTVVGDGIEITVYNDGPQPVTVSQVLVDEAYWKFTAEPSSTIRRLGRATLSIPYPWVKHEAHTITLLTTAGATFEAEVPLATPLPGFSWRQFGAYGLIGVFEGVVPVALGMLWFPALRQMDRRWLESVLALTVGLLVFLLLDTFLEALELAREIPNFFQGILLAIFSALVTWFLLLAVGSQREGRRAASGGRSGLYLAGLIALGIGLHNLGEGLAIGAAFATGEAALGSFLVVGFMLHNVTEGIGISAPLLTGKDDKPAPHILTFLARRHERPVFTWANLADFTFGILVMYLTASLT